VNPVRVRALLLLCALSAGLRASGGTSEAWLGGTLGWDTVPFKEADLEVYGDGADGHPDWGLGTQTGMRDWLQVSAAGRWLTADGTAPLELGAELREPDFREMEWGGGRLGALLPPLAAYGRWNWDGAAWRGRVGLLIVGSAFSDTNFSLVANLEAGPDGDGIRLGWWSPYVAAMLRLGLEWIREDEAGRLGQRWIPQVLVNGPGDLSLTVGLRLDPEGALTPRLLTRLSYQLFPNP
jgi:hypothetical protein